jgi:hypothetical protein
MIDIMLIILILFLIILIGLLITFGTMFVYKKRLTMIFIMPDKSKATKTIHGNVDKQQSFMNGIYLIDDKCIIKKFWGNEIYYFYGNPNPIDFDPSKSFSNIIGTKAQDLKSFHDSDLIQKLFTTENMDKLILLLVVITLIVAVASIVVSVVLNKQPVTLSNNANNTQIIANAVKIALTNPRIV